MFFSRLGNFFLIASAISSPFCGHFAQKASAGGGTDIEMTTGISLPTVPACAQFFPFL
jgi:hypothetical protein